MVAFLSTPGISRLVDTHIQLSSPLDKLTVCTARRDLLQHAPDTDVVALRRNSLSQGGARLLFAGSPNGSPSPGTSVRPTRDLADEPTGGSCTHEGQAGVTRSLGR